MDACTNASYCAFGSLREAKLQRLGGVPFQNSILIISKNNIYPIKGGIKKTVFFFFRKTRERGGGSRRIQNFLIRKNWDFFGFFSKGGGVSRIPKGCYHKKTWNFWIFSPKGGVFLAIWLRTINVAKWGIPEKGMKNVAQRCWPKVSRTLWSKVMAKIDSCI